MPRTETASPEQTERVAAELAARLKAGDVVLVRGEVGSGKTTFVRGPARGARGGGAGKTAFVRGAARALGVGGAVTSPTFTIGQVYAGDGLEVAHLDLYRLAS